MQQSELHWLQNHFPSFFFFLISICLKLFCRVFVVFVCLGFCFSNWEIAVYSSENMKFSIRRVAFVMVFPLKWCWHPNNTNYFFQTPSLPPSSLADSFPHLRAALFFLPGWRMVAANWMLRNWVGSKGGWSTLWKWNNSYLPQDVWHNCFIARTLCSGLSN